MFGAVVARHLEPAHVQAHEVCQRWALRAAMNLLTVWRAYTSIIYSLFETTSTETKQCSENFEYFLSSSKERKAVSSVHGYYMVTGGDVRIATIFNQCQSDLIQINNKNNRPADCLCTLHNVHILPSDVYYYHLKIHDIQLIKTGTPTSKRVYGEPTNHANLVERKHVYNNHLLNINVQLLLQYPINLI